MISLGKGLVVFLWYIFVMTFARFCEHLQKLEKTSKRLEITAIYALMLEELSVTETDKAVYLSLGQMGPSFNTLDFSFAEKMLLRAIVKAFAIDEKGAKDVYDKEGDLGNTAEYFSEIVKTKDKGITINEVYKKLEELAKDSGNGSQERKVEKFSNLLHEVSPLGARYLTRIPLQNTRLGFSEITIVEALSWLNNKDKSLKKEIEKYLHIHPDIGRISMLFKKGGLSALKEIKLEVGVPVLPQLCQRVADANEAIEKLGGKAGSEIKYDGTRVQLHIDRNKKSNINKSLQESFFEHEKNMPFIKTYTRNLEESTNMFPDLIKYSMDFLECENAIIDGEAVGINIKTGEMIPFQETSQRKRKHGIAEKIKEIPLKYFAFDLLYLNGKSLLLTPLSERRELLKKIVKKNENIVVSEQVIVNSEIEILREFKKAKNMKLEGIVLKKLESVYEAGGRGFEWVKFKREDEGNLSDSIDGVIMGYYFGKGDRARFGIGGFLVGVYDKTNDKYLTTTKVGSGATEEEWQKIKKEVDKIKSKEKPINYEVSKNLTCDVYCNPKIVVVIRADEITISDEHAAGYALRFPRLMAIRGDKKPTDTTTVEELKHLYSLQSKKI